MKILYIGNQSKNGQNPTTIDLLSKLLAEDFEVKTASSISFKLFRLLHMLFMTTFSRANFIIIDTYSTQNFLYAYYVSLIARLFNKKYIPILHGGNLLIRYDKDPRVKIYLKKAYKIVAPSNYLKSFFLKEGFENIFEIANPIYVENYRFSEKTLDYPRLFWLRAFNQIYNPQMAIEVFKLVKEKFEKAQLVMVGPNKDGSMEVCKKLVESYQLDVQFTGKLSKEDWMEISKQSNIFINTTNIDNIPMSLIEAGLLGFPIVSTNVGGIPYIIKNEINGFLVEKDDTRGMAEKVIQIVNDPQKSKELILKCQATFKKLDWEFSKEKWLKILQ